MVTQHGRRLSARCFLCWLLLSLTSTTTSIISIDEATALYQEHNLFAKPSITNTTHNRLITLEHQCKQWQSHIQSLRRSTALNITFNLRNHSQLQKFCATRAPTTSGISPDGKDLDSHNNVATERVVFGTVFSDGLGHSLCTYLQFLLVSLSANCTTPALPFQRFTVTRNFVFVPWHGNSSKKLPQLSLNKQLQKPRRFLYCHQKHNARASVQKGASHGVDSNVHYEFRNDHQYILSDAFANNMECFIFHADLWRSMCDVMLLMHPQPNTRQRSCRLEHAEIQRLSAQNNNLLANVGESNYVFPYRSIFDEKRRLGLGIDKDLKNSVDASTEKGLSEQIDNRQLATQRQLGTPKQLRCVWCRIQLLLLKYTVAG